jgi:hypothetical protein
VAGQVEGQLAVTIVANGSMIEWLDWLSAHGADPIAILPAGLAAPRSDTWVAAALGPERMIARAGLIAPDEPAMRDALVESGEEVTTLAPEALHQRLVWLAATLPLNLRTGRFARRRLLLLDWRRLRELAALPCSSPCSAWHGPSLLIRLDRDLRRLEAETARLPARRRPAGHRRAAAAALDTRIGATPGATAHPFRPLPLFTSSCSRSAE